MKTNYLTVRYIFPFRKVPVGASIIIYGCGTIGRQYIEQVCATGYVRISYVVDRTFEVFDGTGLSIKVYAPNRIREDYSGEYIVVAIKSTEMNDAVCRYLKNIGIPEERIVLHNQWYYQIATQKPTWIEHTYCTRKDENIADYIRYMENIRNLLKIKKVDGKELVRIGRKHDGGYIMLDDLNRGGQAYSFGIDCDVSWDADMASRGWDIYMYDHTIQDVPAAHERFHFFRKGIADNEKHDDDVSDLASLIERNHHVGLDGMILKMDVEGAEWGFLDIVSQATLRQFDQIVFEFHDLLEFKQSQRVLQGLTKMNETHQVIHVHGNNTGDVLYVDDVVFPDVLEVTYILKNKYLFQEAHDLELPRTMDNPNREGAPEISLGKWNFLQVEGANRE